MADEIWTPEPIFAGETIICAASGPSLTTAIAAKLRDHRTIVVNSSCVLLPSADVLYFTDTSWYEARRDLVKNWPGMVISMSPAAKRELPEKVLRIKGDGDPMSAFTAFPQAGSPFVRQGRSSGHTAVSLAVALGAVKIALVGYDMRVVDGREHCHEEYAGDRDLRQYAREFVPAFSGWNSAAWRSGVEIVNCTPGSAVTEFPFGDLDEVLACDRR